MAGKVLEGIKVVDGATFIAAPLGAKILGDLGADVIKIENKFTGGDAARSTGAPFLVAENGEKVASFNQTLNAGKRVVTFNLSTQEGVDLLLELLKDADVFIDNRPVGKSERMGIGWEQLHALNPRLVVVRVTGYGMTDTKYRDWLSYDPMFESLAGFMSVTGEPGTPPVKGGTSVGDMAGGIWTGFAALAGLYARTHTGEGQLIDLSLLDAMFSLMENHVATYSFTHKAPQKMGNRHPNIGPMDSFRCKDGKYIFLACGTTPQAHSLFDVIGHPELKEVPGNDLPWTIGANWQINEPLIQEFCDQHTASEVVDTLVAANVAVAPIYDAEDVFNDPYFWTRKLIVKVTDPDVGEIEIPGSPLSFMSATPAVVNKPADRLGGSNEYVLKMLGKTDEEIADLLSRDII